MEEPVAEMVGALINFENEDVVDEKTVVVQKLADDDAVELVADETGGDVSDDAVDEDDAVAVDESVVVENARASESDEMEGVDWFVDDVEDSV